MGLRQRQLRATVGIELREPSVEVGRDRDTATGHLVDANDALRSRAAEHGVALHVPVVLVRHVRLVREVRDASRRSNVSRNSSPPTGRARPAGSVRLQRVLARRAGVYGRSYTGPS